MSRPFPGLEEVEPGRKGHKRDSEWYQDLECVNLFLQQNHSFISKCPCKYKLHPFQDLTDSIFCSHFPVFVVGFLIFLFKEPFLWQSRQRFQKCHGEALQFHASFFVFCFFFKENARGDQRPAVYIQSIFASLSSFLFRFTFSQSLSHAEFLFLLCHIKGL